MAVKKTEKQEKIELKDIEETQEEKEKKQKKKTEKKAEIAPEQIEKLIIELGKKDLTAEKIGLELKKQNIYPKSQGMKISTILKKHSLYKDPDINNLKINIERQKKHIEKHIHDYKTKRKTLEKEAKVRKLNKYHSKKSK